MNNVGLLQDNSGINADNGRIYADNGQIIENNGGLTNPEIATAGLALGKLCHRRQCGFWMIWYDD